MNAVRTMFSGVRSSCEGMFLRELSARVGGNPLLVQASNGNTSIKLGGTLWIKASGKWLAKATREELFIPLNLEEVRARIRAGAAVTEAESPRPEFRPSVETAMHAVLPHRVVVHVHSINAIAWAIRMDAPEQLQERLAGLPWQWIPYTPSGLPLAWEIERAVRKAPETNVFVLGNHGLVVCGPDCSAVEDLLWNVERRIAIPPRRSPKPDYTVLTMIARLSKWRIPSLEEMHALGTDPVSRKVLRGGVLYPCQAIFLGTETPVVPPAQAAAILSRKGDAEAQARPFVIVERSGLLLDDTKVTAAERATLVALAEVMQRTDLTAPLHYLSGAQISEALDNAAGYKQQPA